jgi:hypothetical protein
VARRLRREEAGGEALGWAPSLGRGPGRLALLLPALLTQGQLGRPLGLLSGRRVVELRRAQLHAAAAAHAGCKLLLLLLLLRLLLLRLLLLRLLLLRLLLLRLLLLLLLRLLLLR